MMNEASTSLPSYQENSPKCDQLNKVPNKNNTSCRVIIEMTSKVGFVCIFIII